MDLGLKDRVALVTGASRGIGKAVALALAREGARLALVARDGGLLEACAAEARAAGSSDAVAVAADLGTLAGVTAAVAAAKGRFGRIDILINNAGAARRGPFLEVPDEQWIEDWGLKPLGYIRMVRAVFPIMVEGGGGRIVNVLGSAARNVMPDYLVGGAANAALVNFTKGLAELGAGSNVLVTAVSPHYTLTDRAERRLKARAEAEGRSIAEVRAAEERSQPLGRLARPEDVADLVAFLVSERASFLTGICVTLDGGATRGVYL